jgi:hypothetical protein
MEKMCLVTGIPCKNHKIIVKLDQWQLWRITTTQFLMSISCVNWNHWNLWSDSLGSHEKLHSYVVIALQTFTVIVIIVVKYLNVYFVNGFVLCFVMYATVFTKIHVDSSLPSVVCWRAHVLFMLYLFVCVHGVQHVLSIWVIRWVSYKKQELFTICERMGLLPVGF